MTSNATRIPPENFSRELVSVMKTALEEAVTRIPPDNRTSATKAKMAERIVRTASQGIVQVERLTTQHRLHPQLVEIPGVLVDCVVEPEENVWPMVPAGAPIHEMIGRLVSRSPANP